MKPFYGNLFILAGVIFAILGLTTIFAFHATDKAIPDDFSYDAEIFSVDNFYDAEKGDFSGEEISKTHFSYNVAGEKENVLEIRNVFDVRKLTGDPIISLERLYGIDKKTGRHEYGYGDKDRSGFLFAPRGLKKSQGFTYWHINYDEPAHMEFKNAEHINGLEVYRYQADYHADQTRNLGHLPGVPEERGINLDINLQLWVEPVTGRMIKYEDNTIAYFYDIESGERIHPWNKFNNKYQDVTVNEQVSIAKKEKSMIIWIKFTSISLIAAGIFLVFLGFIRCRSRVNNIELEKSSDKSMQRRVLLGAFAALFVILIPVIFSDFFPKDEDRIMIAIIKWNDNPEFENLIGAFKDKLAEEGFIEGVNIIYLEGFSATDREKHFEIARSFVEQEVDLIFSITTPGTLIVKSITDTIPIVFTIVTYPIESGVVESLENSGNNLVGTRNYVPASRQFAVFERLYPDIKVLGFAHRTNEPNSEVQFQEFKQTLGKRGKEVIKLDGFDVKSLVEKVSLNIDKVDAILLACDTLISFGGDKAIIEFSKASGRNKPIFSCNPDGVVNGALIGNVADWKFLGRVSGEKAALILKGAEPSWLRTESPSEDHIVINMAAVEEARVKIPEDILGRAKEVFR